MNTPVPDDIKAQMVEAWAKGWAVTRGVPPPVKDHEGFRIDTGWPKELRRYIFTEANAGFKALAQEISDPRIFLKVCAIPDLVKEWLPARWIIQSPRFMMTCFKPMRNSHMVLPDDYILSREKEKKVSIVKILTRKGTTVAIGRVVVVDQYVIYDRIETIPEYRRRGLATMMMLELEAIGTAQGGNKGVLVATAEGKKLYEKLGWETYTSYTTAVIPDPEDQPC